MEPQISKLVSVDVRVLWPMEASGFTPWLLADDGVDNDPNA